MSTLNHGPLNQDWQYLKNNIFYSSPSKTSSFESDHHLQDSIQIQNELAPKLIQIFFLKISRLALGLVI